MLQTNHYPPKEEANPAMITESCALFQILQLRMAIGYKLSELHTMHYNGATVKSVTGPLAAWTFRNWMQSEV